MGEKLQIIFLMCGNGNCKNNSALFLKILICTFVSTNLNLNSLDFPKHQGKLQLAQEIRSSNELD